MVVLFEPHRKAANQIWAVKHLKRPCIARRVQSAKKVLYAIFFDIKGHVLQIAVPKRRGITSRFLLRLCSKKPEIILYKTPTQNWIQEH